MKNNQKRIRTTWGHRGTRQAWHGAYTPNPHRLESLSFESFAATSCGVWIARARAVREASALVPVATAPEKVTHHTVDTVALRRVGSVAHRVLHEPEVLIRLTASTCLSSSLKRQTTF